MKKLFKYFSITLFVLAWIAFIIFDCYFTYRLYELVFTGDK